jgi:type II secretory pathway pseudopilin PulG
MTLPDLRSERGFTMIAVMVVMAVATALAGGALLAAQQDLPFSKATGDRKQAYAAAEAGVEYYLYQMTSDNDYWTKCDAVPAPAPVNQKGANPRKWRTITGTNSRYTIELLPAVGSVCTAGSAETTLLDQTTGTIKIRATGKAGPTGKQISRTIVADFRRDSFLDFLYFTDFETFSPEAYVDIADQDYAKLNCVDYRNDRPNSNSNPCAKIQFISADVNRGPFHTNDDILACGGYTLGRNSADKIEIVGPNKWQNPGTGTSICNSGEPNIQGTLDFPAKTMHMPTTNATLKARAGVTFTGRTWLKLHDGVMDVTTWPLGVKTTATDQPLPANGVIYVKNGSCSGTQSPLRQTYNEGAGCANVTVYGSYSKSLTIGSEKDIIVGTPVDPLTNTPLLSTADLTRSGDVVLGLIADKFVRVSHPVSRQADGSCIGNRLTTAAVPKAMTDITIDAAILSLNHSFIADNHDCGDLGTLSVTGAIAQKFRGPVGTTAPTGFTKNYEYDDRLKYRSPPFFLNPIDAAWNIMRENELLPAAKGTD